jgi:hypothetical protein
VEKMTKAKGGYKIRPDGKKDTGRPSKIKLPELQKLEMAFKMGCDNREACAFAEIKESTFYLYCKNNPDFLDKIEAWKINPILKAKRTVYSGLDNVDTAKWYLERKRKDEFSTKVENETEIKGLEKALVKWK